MKKWWRISAVALLLVFLLSSTGIAQAWWGWCWWDPIVNIGGHTVNIDIGFPEDAIDLIQKDLRITLETARDLLVALPGTALANQLFAANQAVGEGRDGTQGLARTIERLAKLS